MMNIPTKTTNIVYGNHSYHTHSTANLWLLTHYLYNVRYTCEMIFSHLKFVMPYIVRF